VLACVALCVAVATFSIALAFVFGAAIYVLIGRDRWSRAWVVLVPVALYGAWWLWSLSEPSSSESAARISNVLLIPNFVAESAAVMGTALTGLGYAFDGGSDSWYAIGRPLAAIGFVLLGVKLTRGNVPRSLWVALGLAFALWTLGALTAGPARAPHASRYVFSGSVAVLLVATAAAGGIRFSRAGLAALFAVAAVAVAGNLALLRDGSHVFRLEYSPTVRANLAMVELARDRVDPEYNAVRHVPQMIYNPFTAGAYLDAVDAYGSPAFSPAEVAAQGEAIREGADLALTETLGVRVTAAPGGPHAACRTERAGGSGGIAFEVPRGGADLRIRAAAPSPVEVGRFGARPSVRAGTAAPGEWVRLKIPADGSPAPWRAAVKASSVEVCAPG
jgi:hypothetical protein